MVRDELAKENITNNQTKNKNNPIKLTKLISLKRRRKNPNCLMGVSWGVIKISEAPANAYA